MSDDESWEERHLKANANEAYMAGVAAELIRNCMRGVAAQNNANAAYGATKEFVTLVKLIRYLPGANLMQIFSDAINEIRPPRDDDIGNKETFADRYYERSIHSAATAGVRFLVEQSCRDNAAKGRSSRRESEFLDALGRIEQARANMAEQRGKRLALDAPSATDIAERALASIKPSAMPPKRKPKRAKRPATS